MRIHHVNCVSACPLGGFVMDGMTTNAIRGRLTSHCLLLEKEGGLVLVDTGYGLRDVADPRSRLSKFFLTFNKPELREEMTAFRQIERLGLAPLDVRHIVLSHLDFDHAGGLDDFANATVHLLADEVRSATAQRTALDRMRYRTQQWGSRARWVTYGANEGEPWLGFDHVQELAGIGPDVLLVPLIGHTLGHAGVAVRRASGWLFYAADAYFYHREMHVQHPLLYPRLGCLPDVDGEGPAATSLQPATASRAEARPRRRHRGLLRARRARVRAPQRAEVRACCPAAAKGWSGGR